MNDEQLDRLHNLLFGVRRSVRYHSHRIRFFDGLNKTVRVLTSVSGAGVVASVLSARLGAGWTNGFAAAVASAAALDLVIDSAEKARLHASLYRDFIDLERRIVLAGKALDDSALDRFDGDRLVLESKEPPVLRVLDVICHNELLRAMGEGGRAVRVSRLQRALAQFLDFRTDQFKEVSA